MAGSPPRPIDPPHPHPLRPSVAARPSPMPSPPPGMIGARAAVPPGGARGGANGLDDWPRAQQRRGPARWEARARPDIPHPLPRRSRAAAPPLARAPPRQRPLSPPTQSHTPPPAGRCAGRHRAPAAPRRVDLELPLVLGARPRVAAPDDHGRASRSGGPGMSPRRARPPLPRASTQPPPPPIRSPTAQQGPLPLVPLLTRARAAAPRRREHGRCWRWSSQAPACAAKVQPHSPRRRQTNPHLPYTASPYPHPLRTGCYAPAAAAAATKARTARASGPMGQRPPTHPSRHNKLLNSHLQTA
jgi:hypothetical protein